MTQWVVCPVKTSQTPDQGSAVSGLVSWGFPWGSTFLAPLEEHPPQSCTNTYRPQRCTILITFQYCLSAPSFQCIHTFPFLPYPCVLFEGGRQFKITPGDLIVVNRLAAKIGMCIFLDKVRAVILMITTCMHA